MKWQDKLTKKDLRHLKKVAGVTTLAGAKRTFEVQAKMRQKMNQPEDDNFLEPCWECRAIARKLGFKV